MDYKELANKMRRTALEYKGGNLSVSPELWEEIADALEKLPEGAAVVALLLWIVREKEVEIGLKPSMFPGNGEICVEMRYRDHEFKLLFKPDTQSVVPVEEDFFFRLKRQAEVLLRSVEEEV